MVITTIGNRLDLPTHGNRKPPIMRLVRYQVISLRTIFHLLKMEGLELKMLIFYKYIELQVLRTSNQMAFLVSVQDIQQEIGQIHTKYIFLQTNQQKIRPYLKINFQSILPCRVEWILANSYLVAIAKKLSINQYNLPNQQNE